MMDETLFYERFLDDVRDCAPGRRAAVLEVGRRLRGALAAPPLERERRWGQVARAVRALLAVAERESEPVRRLRAFLRENADLSPPREPAVSDFEPALHPVAPR
ncbi:MAG: hypothetical protein ABSD03_08790 [Vulcanimicrobiaceae bacterium]|jgi:hypothetical protein